MREIIIIWSSDVINISFHNLHREKLSCICSVLNSEMFNLPWQNVVVTFTNVVCKILINSRKCKCIECYYITFYKNVLHFANIKITFYDATFPKKFTSE